MSRAAPGRVEPGQAAPTVYLFDIDGTLITSGGAGRRAMAAGLAAVHGPRGRTAIDFPFAGMTDRAIVRAALIGLGVEPDQAAIDRALESYLTHLDGELERTPSYCVLPGVRDVLDWLAPQPDAAVGLGTGNVKRGAMRKLARGRIDGAFAFGGFGCDAESRIELLRIGAERGATALGRALAECRVIVIGDTPKDIVAAHGIGAACIAVGTGGFEPEELRALGAAHAFATLDAEGVRSALQTVTSR